MLGPCFPNRSNRATFQYRWSTLALLDPFFPSRKMFPNPFLVRLTDSTKESVGGLLDLNMNTRSRM